MYSLLDLFKIWLFDTNTKEINFIKFIKNFIKNYWQKNIIMIKCIYQKRRGEKMLKNSKNNILYIIQFGKEKYYKIGITNNINKRLSNLQVRKP